VTLGSDLTANIKKINNSEQTKTKSETQKRSKHDEFSKYLLKNMDMVVSLLVGYLQNEKYFPDIDLKTGHYLSESTISRHLGEEIRDIVVGFKSQSNPEDEYNFLILIEQQTKPQDDMTLRMLEYFVSFYRFIYDNQ
jgi:hypothetical protein